MKAPKEDVKELIDSFSLATPYSSRDCALIAIRFASNILKSYGERSGELQNMEMEFRYLDSMEEQIKNSK